MSKGGKHGHSQRGGWSSTYYTWASMIQRCTNTKRNNYKDYGGRGVKVCDRWLVFEKFLEDMGERPEGLSLDRRDNEKGYDRSNCRWATPDQQARNRRSSKLEQDDIPIIKAMHASGSSSRAIGRKFGVSKTMILHILNGRQWK